MICHHPNSIVDGSKRKRSKNPLTQFRHLIICALVCSQAHAGIVVSNVRAAQRVITKPEDAKKVDIWYDAVESGSPGPAYLGISISDDDGETFLLPATNLERSSSQTGTNLKVTWNAGKDWNRQVSPNIRFKLTPVAVVPDTPDGDGTDATENLTHATTETPAPITWTPPPNPPDGDDGDGTDGTGTPNDSTSALSNRTFVDTRDPEGESLNALDGIANLVDEPTSTGHRSISYEMTDLSLPRPRNGPVTVYLQVKIPNFADQNAGWGKMKGGLGTFYGLEMKTLDSAASSRDSIFYKIGGNPPTPDSSGWMLTTFDTIINVRLKAKTQGEAETYYFKINLSPGVGELVVSAQYKSARLCNNSGGPIAGLSTGKPLWLVVHGKRDGEASFRSLNTSVRATGNSAQVASLDWASGASGYVADLSNGRYFTNLGKNMAGLLLEKGLRSKNVNCVGHSWGTLVGYETALAFGRYSFNRFCALDPATQALGGYDDSRVNFFEVSVFSVGVRGGLGLFGSDRKAKTCDFPIRVFPRFPESSLSLHGLPIDWFSRAMSPATDGWPVFKRKLTKDRTSVMPWNSNKLLRDGFQLHVHETSSVKHQLFSKKFQVNFKSNAGKNTTATIKRGKSGFKTEDWIYDPSLE